MKPKGGRRAGAGRKPGFKFPATISKEQARDALRGMVIAHLKPLVDAQLANASGLKYLVARDPKTGKFERIGPEGVAGAAGIEVWEKDPNVSAFADLLNRALDKPAEHVEMTVTKTQNASDDELAKRLESLSQKLLKG